MEILEIDDMGVEIKLATSRHNTSRMHTNRTPDKENSKIWSDDIFDFLECKQSVFINNLDQYIEKESLRLLNSIR